MEHLFFHFSEHRAELERGLEKDADLREMCEDYETIARQLAQLDQQAGISTRLTQECRELLESLATEIAEMLASALENPTQNQGPRARIKEKGINHERQ